ncbi:hypothetical protein L209DRAFT_39380 [Thermothelomyces heterothallicus CBS 203.75]
MDLLPSVLPKFQMKVGRNVAKTREGTVGVMQPTNTTTTIYRGASLAKFINYSVLASITSSPSYPLHGPWMAAFCPDSWLRNLRLNPSCRELGINVPRPSYVHSRGGASTDNTVSLHFCLATRRPLGCPPCCRSRTRRFSSNPYIVISPGETKRLLGNQGR